MKIRFTRIAIWLVAILSISAALCGHAAEQAAKGPKQQASPPAAKPAHRVVACYFHRTVRCPTCKKISAYAEEAVKTGMAAEMKAGKVQWVMIDFQDPENEKFTTAYDITGPTLVIMDVNNEKVTAWKVAPKVWSLVGDKQRFFKYVQGEVRAYLEAKQAAATQSGKGDWHATSCAGARPNTQHPGASPLFRTASQTSTR